MLDFLEGRDTERTRLTISRRLPVPIPSDLFAYPLIQIMRRAVEKPDRNACKNGFLLRFDGLVGVGFYS